MRKIWLVPLLVGAVLLATVVPASASSGGSYLVFNGIQTNQDSAWINVSTADAIHVQAWSASGSQVVINVYCASSQSAPPYPCIPDAIRNPDEVTGEYWDIPVTMFLKITTSGWTSGTVYVSLETHIYK